MLHGGDIYRNKVKRDFSVNVNPLGTPQRVVKSINASIEKLDSYPDYEYENLRNKISERLKINSDYIICGNGASELFMAVVHSIKPSKAIVPVPSFYGYERAISSSDSKIVNYYMREEKGFLIDDDILDMIETNKDTDIIVLANPNNPTGNYIETNLLKRLIEKCSKNNIAVLLDECFMELSDNTDNSSISLINDYDNLLIVRAFTKTFAMPALRLGYLVGSDIKTLSEIRNQLSEWNVSLLAQNAGIAALEETDYLDVAKKIINDEREYITNEIKKLGIKVYPSAANFILLYSDISLYERLLERGILIRDCSDFKGLSEGYYRIAIKCHEDNVILVDALKEIVLE